MSSNGYGLSGRTIRSWPGILGRESAHLGFVKRSTIFQAAHVLVGLHELLHERLDDGLCPPAQEDYESKSFSDFAASRHC